MFFSEYPTSCLVWRVFPGNDYAVPGFMRGCELSEDLINASEIFEEEINNAGWVTGEGMIDGEYEFISVIGIDPKSGLI